MSSVPPVRGNTRAERRALRLQEARGRQHYQGEAMQDTAAAGQDTGSVDETIWFLPTGAVRGTRNTHRVRGWIIAVAVAVALWAIIGIAVTAIISWLA